MTTTIIDEKKSKKILLLLFLGVLMGALDISIVGPALPSIQETIAIDKRNLSWIFTIYVLFNLVGTPLMSKMADIYGRKSTYISSLIIFGLGSLLVSLSNSFELLLVGRGIQGFGASGIFPVATAIIGDIFPPEKRGQKLGLIGAVFGIAFIIGPIIAGFLLMINWHWLFIINLPIIVFLVIWGLKILPANKSVKKGKFDYQGMIVIGLLLTSFSFGINNIETKDFFHSLATIKVAPLLIVAVILVFIFRMIEKKASDPILKLNNFNSRQVKIASILAMAAGVFETTMVFIPDYAVEAFHVTASKASFMLIPVIIALAITAPISGKMLDKIGSKIVIITGTSSVAIGLLLLSVSAENMILFYSSEVLIGIGLSMLLGASIRYIMLNEVPATERTSIQGVITIFTSIGQMSGAATAGAVVDSYGGNIEAYSYAYLAVSIFTFGIVFISFFLKNRKEELETIARNSI